MLSNGGDHPDVGRRTLPVSASWPADDAAALAEIWAEHRATTLERVAVLDRASAALGAGTLDDPLRTEACREAHTLVGSAAMFGFHAAADIARVLEGRYDAGPASGEAPELSRLARELRIALDRTP